MKFAKHAQFAIGLAAGGGLAMVLGGNALAAQPSVGEPQASVQQSTTAALPTQQSADQISVVGGLVTHRDWQDITGNQLPAQTIPHESGGIAAPEGQGAATSAQTATGVNAETSNSGAGGPTGLAASSQPEKPVVAGQSDRTMTPGPKPGALLLSPIVSGLSHDLAPIPVISVMVSGPGGHLGAMRPRALLVQPVITNRFAIMGGDLTAMTPLVRLPPRTPMPIKSSGLWGRLTAVLAGAAMPGASVWVFGPTGGHMLAPVCWWLVVVLCGTGFAYNYGFWLRQSGFAHAARSDSALAKFSLLAVSLQLGFVRVGALGGAQFLMTATLRRDT